VKALYYLLVAAPIAASGYIYRALLAPASGNASTVRVHLGPGQDHYKIGWINVDANILTARIDVWADLRNKLPFRDNSVDAFYSHHVIEHLPDGALPFHFRDMYRCLKPGGVVRIGGPNGDEACRNFAEGNRDWFVAYGEAPSDHQSLGGQLVSLLICRGEHLTILTQSYLRELLERAGFTDIAARKPVMDTRYPALFDDAIAGEWEATPDSPHTLLVEAIKPR